MANSSSSAVRLVLVGVRGFGAVHAERIARLAERGVVELVAAVDPGVVLDPPTIYGVHLYADLSEALSAVGPVDAVALKHDPDPEGRVSAKCAAVFRKDHAQTTS